MAVLPLLFVTGCSTEIGEYDYGRVKDMAQDVPELSPAVQAAFKDGQIDCVEFTELREQYDKLRLTKVKNELREVIQK